MKTKIAYNSASYPIPDIPGAMLTMHELLVVCQEKEIPKAIELTIRFGKNAKVVRADSKSHQVGCEPNKNCVVVLIDWLKRNEPVLLSFVTSSMAPIAPLEVIPPDGMKLEKKDDLILDVAQRELPMEIGTSFIVASALQEELDPFLDGKHIRYLPDEPLIKSFPIVNWKREVFNVLCYSIDQMGMPFNAVALTRLIEKHKPKYAIFIGTCGGFTKTKKVREGDLLVPAYIYAYDSGKYDDKGEFQIEYRHYDVSVRLLSLLGDMLRESRQKEVVYKFNIERGCGFCSGSSVISSKTMRDKIKKLKNRKVLGFDMEAYVMAVIQHLYGGNIDTAVIKGIMDFGTKKNDKFKQMAQSNAASLTYDLLKFIVENVPMKPAQSQVVSITSSEIAA